jgi:hypothetical protein
VSEPGAIATGPGSLLRINNETRGRELQPIGLRVNLAALLDQVATAPGSDTSRPRLEGKFA